MNHCLGFMIIVLILVAMTCNGLQRRNKVSIAARRKRVIDVVRMKMACAVELDNHLLASNEMECECRGDFIRQRNPESCVESVCKSSPVDPCHPGRCIDAPDDKNLYQCECPGGKKGGYSCQGPVKRKMAKIKVQLGEKRKRQLMPHTINFEVEVGEEIKKLDLIPRFIMSKEFKIVKAETEDGQLSAVDFPPDILHLMLGHVFTTPDKTASLYMSRDRVMKAEGMMDNYNKLSFEFPVRRSFAAGNHLVSPIQRRIYRRKIDKSKRESLRKDEMTPAREREGDRGWQGKQVRSEKYAANERKRSSFLDRVHRRRKREEVASSDDTSGKPEEPDATGDPSLNSTLEPDATGEPSLNSTLEPDTTGEPSLNSTLEPGATGETSLNLTLEPDATGEPSLNSTLEPDATGEPSLNSTLEPGATGEPSLNLTLEPDATGEPSLNSTLEPDATGEPSLNSTLEPDATGEPSLNSILEPVATGEPSLNLTVEAIGKSPLNATEESEKFCGRQVTLNIMILYDDLNSEILEEEPAKLITYLTTFWNKVDTLYMDDYACPRIRLQLGGVVILSKEVTDSLLGSTISDGFSMEETLEKVTSWYEKNQDDAAIPVEIDSIIFQTNYKLYKSDTNEDYPSHTVLGCPSYVVVTDKAGEYESYTHASHALHPIFGATLDTDKQGCTSEDGYLLYADKLTDGLKKLTFSPCSFNDMSRAVKQPERKCLWDDPMIFFPEDLLPGSMTSLSEQCIQGTDKPEAYFSGTLDKEVCEKVKCHDGTEEHVLEEPALDGSPCGFNKMCIYKKCIHFAYPTIYDICRKLGSNFRPIILDACEELKCYKMGKEGEIAPTLRPYEGTPCKGGFGICSNGTCFPVLTESGESGVPNATTGEGEGDDRKGDGDSEGHTQTPDSTPLTDDADTGDPMQSPDATPLTDDADTGDPTQSSDATPVIDDADAGDPTQSLEATPLTDDADTGDPMPSPDATPLTDDANTGDPMQSPDATPHTDDANTGDPMQSPEATPLTGDVDTGDPMQSPDATPLTDDADTGDPAQSPDATPLTDDADTGDPTQSSDATSLTDGADTGDSKQSPDATPLTDDADTGDPTQTPDATPLTNDTNTGDPTQTSDATPLTNDTDTGDPAQTPDATPLINDADTGDPAQSPDTTPLTDDADTGDPTQTSNATPLTDDAVTGDPTETSDATPLPNDASTGDPTQAPDSTTEKQS